MAKRGRPRKNPIGTGDGLVRLTVMMDEKHLDRLRDVRERYGINYQTQLRIAVEKAVDENPEFQGGQPVAVRIAVSPDIYKYLEIIKDERNLGFSSLIRFALDNTDPIELP